jgi:hypothetical protein
MAEIIRVLLELELEKQSNSSGIISEERKQELHGLAALAASICNVMKNQSKNLAAGNGKQVRCSTRIMSTRSCGVHLRCHEE